MPGIDRRHLVACVAWGYLLYSGDIGSMWTLFGVSNQLMAADRPGDGAPPSSSALAEKRRYMLTCSIPLAYLYVTVNSAGYWMIVNVYLNASWRGYNLFNAVLSIVMLVLGAVILMAALRKWKELLQLGRSSEMGRLWRPEAFDRSR